MRAKKIFCYLRQTYFSPLLCRNIVVFLFVCYFGGREKFWALKKSLFIFLSVILLAVGDTYFAWLMTMILSEVDDCREV